MPKRTLLELEPKHHSSCRCDPSPANHLRDRSHGNEVRAIDRGSISATPSFVRRPAKTEAGAPEALGCHSKSGDRLTDSRGTSSLASVPFPAPKSSSRYDPRQESEAPSMRFGAFRRSRHRRSTVAFELPRWRASSALRVSHPLSGLIPPGPCGFVSRHFRP